MKLLMNRNPIAEFDQLFRSLERNLESPWRTNSAGHAHLPMDVYEKADAFYIRATVPGARDEDLDLSIEKDVVTLKVTLRADYGGEDTKVYLLETPYGSFTRSIRVPEACQADQAEARFDRGVVTIRIPKMEKPASSRSIPILDSFTATNPPLLEASVASEKTETES